MQAKDLIQKKREGETLSQEELKFLIHGYVEGDIPDYQMAAFLMAVYFKGMEPEELSHWTRWMWQSGRTFPRPAGKDYWIDKHSTGGVGDKTSLLLVPIVAAVCERLFGPKSVRLPMVSGRGLGHTGGTLDKLESVPGFSSALSIEQAADLLENQGFIMMGQTEDMAPADRLLYALRDVTGTVESQPLIVSSIMSKKLSENLNGIVFDVKVGRGAFMKSEADARALADGLIETAQAQGVDAVAVLTRMEEPLGLRVGHHLEVAECADFLDGHTRDAGLAEVTRNLAGWMIHLASRKELSLDDAKTEVERELAGPVPLELFKKMFASQGGQWTGFERARERLEEETVSTVWHAPSDGWVHRMDAEAIGKLVGRCGGGRQSKEDKLDLLVGARIHKKVGDYVYKGDPVLEMLTRDNISPETVTAELDGAIEVNGTAVNRTPWIIGVREGK